MEKNMKTVNVIKDSDENRKKRARRVRFIKWLKIVPSTVRNGEHLPKSWKKYEFECLSKEKTEGRTHQGYITLDKQNSIRDCYCSCADFQFRYGKMVNSYEIQGYRNTFSSYKRIS